MAASCTCVSEIVTIVSADTEVSQKHLADVIKNPKNISKEAKNMSECVTQLSYNLENIEKKTVFLPELKNSNYSEGDIVSDEVMSEDSMSENLLKDRNLSEDISDDTASETASLLTDESMSDDETYDFITHDANIINSMTEDTNEINDSKRYFILNLASNNVENFDNGTTGNFGVKDINIDNNDLDSFGNMTTESLGINNIGIDNNDIANEQTVANVANQNESKEGVIRSRLSRIKAFFSRSEQSISVSETSQNMSDDLQNASENSQVTSEEGFEEIAELDNVSDDDVFQENTNVMFKEKDEFTLVTELEDTIDTLHNEYLTWRKSRLQSIEEIRAMADNLDGHQRNVDIAKVTGTSVGAAATVAGIVFTSLALAPVTAGSSIFIGLGIGAGVIGGAGVGTGIGAVVTKKKLERGKWERLQQIVKEDSEVTDSLKMTIQRYDKILTSVTNLVKEKEEAGTARTILQAVRGTHTLAEKITVTVLKDVIRSAAGVTTEAVEGGAKAALVAGRVLGGIGIALGGIALVIDIIYLVQVGRNIRSGSKCDVAKRLRNVARILEEEMRQIDDVLTFDLSRPSSRSISRSRSLMYDIGDLDDEMAFDDMTFGKLHIDTSAIYSEWSDDGDQQLILHD